MKKVGFQHEPEDIILAAVTAKLYGADLGKYFKEMKKSLRNAGFKDTAKFGLLRQAEMEIPELAKFAMYRSDRTYDALN